MANPRNIIRKDGIGAVWDTFLIDNVTITYDETEERGTAQRDLALTYSADDTVALTTDGSVVVGKLIKVEADGKATVQIGGWATFAAGAGAAVTRGEKIVGDLDTAARGYIRAVATGTAAELGHARHMIGHNADPTQVWVLLDIFR